MRSDRPSSRARRRVARPAVVLALGVVGGLGASLVLAGCTGEEPVAPEPSTSSVETEPAETAEPSPTETGPPAPERPAAMERDDAEGAAAAAEFFMALIPIALAEQDASAVQAMSHETCGFCESNIDDVEWLIANDGSYSGGSLDVEIPDPRQYQRDEATGIFPLDATIRQGAIRVVDGDGEVVGDVEPTTWNARIEVGRTNGHWVIVEVATTGEESK